MHKLFVVTVLSTAILSDKSHLMRTEVLEFQTSSEADNAYRRLNQEKFSVAGGEVSIRVIRLD